MDEDRRRRERATRREPNVPEVLVREALHLRRTGELEPARERLVRALELAPDHELARALLLVTDLALGRRAHGTFGEARLRSIDLVRLLDRHALDEVARAAIDPRHGAPDAEAIGALMDGGKTGVLAVLGALAGVDVLALADRLRIAVGLRARDVAALEIAPDEVPAPLRLAVADGLARPGLAGAADCALLAGALGLSNLRAAIEALLDAEELSARNAAAVSLELLRDGRSRPALERALARAEKRGEKLLLERALAALR